MSITDCLTVGAGFTLVNCGSVYGCPGAGTTEGPTGGVTGGSGNSTSYVTGSLKNGMFAGTCIWNSSLLNLIISDKAVSAFGDRPINLRIASTKASKTVLPL